MPEIILVDTTLRDGEQAPGFAFAPQLKIRLARLLDAAGVGQIEAGVPAMGTTERDVVRGVRAYRDLVYNALSYLLPAAALLV